MASEEKPGNERTHGRGAAKFAHIAVDKVIFGRHFLARPIQVAIQKLLGGPKEVIFRFKRGPISGFRFSCLSSHRYFFLRNDYEYEILEPIQKLLHPGSIAFEIGAHFGFWALVLSRLVGSTGQVFAFEPSPSNRAQLSRNLELNSIENVRVVPLAASDGAGTSQLSENGSMASIGVGAVEIETTTLDEFCKDAPLPDFVLIDVEGHAGSVLGGASAVFDKRRPPIICEIHDKQELDAVETFLAKRSYRCVRLTKSARFPYRIVAT
jgi:FkbM family methyltransferase